MQNLYVIVHKMHQQGRIKSLRCLRDSRSVARSHTGPRFRETLVTRGGPKDQRNGAGTTMTMLQGSKFLVGLFLRAQRAKNHNLARGQKIAQPSKELCRHIVLHLLDQQQLHTKGR